jgi:hypothetical protein
LLVSKKKLARGPWVCPRGPNMGYMELLPCTVGSIPGVPGVPGALVIVLGGLVHGGTSSLSQLFVIRFRQLHVVHVRAADSETKTKISHVWCRLDDISHQ